MILSTHHSDQVIDPLIEDGGDQYQTSIPKGIFAEQTCFIIQTESIRTFLESCSELRSEIEDATYLPAPRLIPAPVVIPKPVK